MEALDCNGRSENTPTAEQDAEVKVQHQSE